MTSWLKNIIRIFSIFFLLVVLLWLGLATYVYYNKKELLAGITKELNGNLSGKLTVRKMEPDLIKGFPAISVSLQDVLLRDSLFNNHQHDLLRAAEVFISIDLFSLIGPEPKIRRIEISHGEIYLFTDTLGRSNTDLFKKNAAGAKGKGGIKKVNQLYLKQVNLTVEDRLNKKYLKFSIPRFLGEINYATSGWKAKANLDALVKNFELNTARGSFMKNKMLKTKLKLSYSTHTHQLVIPSAKFLFDQDELYIGGQFSFAANSSKYHLEIKAPQLLLSHARSLLLPHISKVLASYGVLKPLKVQANLNGYLKSKEDPRIKVEVSTQNNTLKVFGQTISQCAFSGTYLNEAVKGKGYNDANSVITFKNLKGEFFEIPFKAPFVKFTDLKNTVFTGKFKAVFPLKSLNTIIGGESFEFNSGKVSLDLLYKAPYNANSIGEHYLLGTIKVKNGGLMYKPRNLSFKKTDFTLLFNGQDLLIQNVSLSTKTSKLLMEGQVKNFANFYYTDPRKLLIDWNISSAKLNLGDFIGFVGKRNQIKPKIKLRKGISNQLDKALDEASFRLKIQVDKMVYKRFTATRVNADIILKQSGLLVNKVSLKQGGGSLQLNGHLDQSGSLNRFHVNATINNVNVQHLFYAFNNFGQLAITDQNLRGNYFGKANMSGNIRDNGDIVPHSFQGRVVFDIRHGALLNFEPLKKIGAFAFPNRDFSNITFKSLKNSLFVKGNMIHIPPMHIESSVLNVFLNGVYGLTSGTNIALQIPLRNPKKDEMIGDSSLRAQQAKKGIVINLRAVEENGQIKFKLGKGKASERPPIQ